MNRAAIYVRVSTEEQARDGYSIEAQINTLKLYAELYSMEVVSIYKDEGISGKSIERPGLVQMLDDAENKIFDTLLVWKVSRLSRNLKNLLSIVEKLDNRGISFVSHSETFNTSTPVGKMTLQILGSIAEFERNTIIENVRLGLMEKAKRGEWLGGRVFGYKNVDKKLVINESSSKIIKEIFEKFINGWTLYEIAKHLNEKGFRSVRNKSFTVSSVSRILSNPVYIGLLRHNVKDEGKYFIIKGQHQPIISEDDFYKVQDKFNKTKINVVGGFLLSGVLKCPLCGGGMARYKTSGYRYYRCSKYHNHGKKECKGFRIPSDQIEELVFKEIEKYLDNPEILKNVYDNLKIDGIFAKNYYSCFNKSDIIEKKRIIKHIISQIKLTSDKKIEEIIFRV